MTRKYSLIAYTGLVIAALALPSAVSAREPDLPPACRTIDADAVKALFDGWVTSLKDQTARSVVDEYATDASLLPTVESGPLIGRDQIRPYFIMFVKKHPTVISRREYISTGCNVAYDIGLYTFRLTENGVHKEVPARFTFIYAPDADGVWHIVHHHSSAVPKQPASRAR